MNLNQKSIELVNDIKQTNEFIQLKRARANIEKYKDLKNEIELFQKQQMNLFYLNKSENEIAQLSKNLDYKFKNLSSIPEVKQLIRAGKNFNTMLFNVYKNINHTIDLELKS